MRWYFGIFSILKLLWSGRLVSLGPQRARCNWAHTHTCVKDGRKDVAAWESFQTVNKYDSCVCVYISRLVVSDSVASGTGARQAPLSMGVSRRECCSGLPFPSPGDLPNPGIEPWSLTLQANSFPSEPPGKAIHDSKWREKMGNEI